MDKLRRAIDITAGTAGLVVFFVPMAVMAAVARIESKQTGLFRQTRYGLHGKPFEILKIRTLDRDNKPLSLMGWVRKTGADELPQLVNIIKGDMSIIGPRPHDRLLKNVPGWSHTLEIHPGLTGAHAVAVKLGEVPPGPESLAKVEGQYVDLRHSRQSALPMDLQIIGRTMQVVLGGRADRKMLDPTRLGLRQPKGHIASIPQQD